MPMTLEEIRQRGLEALRRELGPAGMVRFLQQFESGSGDYAKERRAWVDGTSLDDLRALAAKKPAKRKRPAK
jgi:hypothetical protein